MNYLLATIIIYLYASIPFSYLIGKLIYKEDILKEGSQNPGGSNLGRTCGKTAFIFGFLLDASKGAVAVLVASVFDCNVVIIAIVALIGHALPIFLNFRGGKGVATACGFVLVYTFWGAVFALTVFGITLYLKKYVSLASIVAIGAYLVYAIFYQTWEYAILIAILYVGIIYLHRTNIQRIIEGTERKISWI